MQTLANFISAAPARKTLGAYVDGVRSALTWLQEVAVEVRQVRDEAMSRMR